MKNLAKILLATMVLGAASSSAWAENPYGAIDIGQTKGSNLCTGAAAGCKDNSGAFRVALGYQFVPMMGGEVSYGYYGKASLGPAGDWKASGFAISGIGALPVGNGFSLTAKLGLAATTLDNTAAGRSTTSTNLAYGIGGRFDFNRDIALRIQYESLGDVGNSTTGTTKLNLFTAGLVARF